MHPFEIKLYGVFYSAIVPEGPQQNAVYYDWFIERLGEVAAPSHLESAISMDAMKLMGAVLAVYGCGAESIK